MRKNKIAAIDDDGIKISYNNRTLKEDYGVALLKLAMEANEEEPETPSKIRKEEWLEIYRKIGLPVLEFCDNYMVIPWDAVEGWGIIEEMRRRGRCIYKNSIDIRGLEFPVEIMNTERELKDYFNKLIPEKEEDKVSIVKVIKVKKFFIGIYVIMVAMLIIKFILSIFNIK